MCLEYESDPRSNVHYLSSSENKAWKKIQACTGFEPMTSVIPVQRSTNWANKLIRSLYFRPYFHYCLSSVHYCEDHFHIQVLICSSNIWLSNILSRLIMSPIKWSLSGQLWRKVALFIVFFIILLICGTCIKRSPYIKLSTHHLPGGDG